MECSYNVLVWFPKKTKKKLMGPFGNVRGTFCVCWEGYAPQVQTAASFFNPLTATVPVPGHLTLLHYISIKS